MSRKYRQRGYQDEGPPARRGTAPPRERGEGPRGRGLGAPTASVFRCHRCGRRQPEGAPAVDARCAGCGAALHSCTHCASFDTSAPFECREPIERRIRKKEAANECERFRIKLSQEFEREAPAPDQARAAFDDLFKF